MGDSIVLQEPVPQVYYVSYIILNADLSVYGAVANMASYLAETTPAESEVLRVQWPIGDDELVQEWEKLILKISEESNGKRRVKLGIFDTILSQPGARAPFER